jgi:hypothetical protein
VYCFQGGKSKTSVLQKGRSSKKYQEIPINPDKYGKVPDSTKKRKEAHRNILNYDEVYRSV